MTLSAAVKLAIGALRLDVEVDVDEAVVAVVGPNGAGKTTLLRALAGLIPLVGGRVVADGRVVEDPAANLRVRPEERRFGVVFQEHRLFANLTALENVAFGLRARGVARGVARRRAADWLERVGLPDVAGRRPRELSGGEAQRVALARALATEPTVLLLDEPLAAVDASARAELRRALRSELRRYPGSRLVVTHDPIEAAALADRLLVLEAGAVTQQGALAEVTARPRSPWVATMVGLNLLTGSAQGATIVLGTGQSITASGSAQGPVFVAFRPNAVTLHRSRPDGSARNLWAGVVAELYPAGDRARVRVDGAVPLVAEVTAAAVAELHLDDGGPIWAALKATEVDVYPA
ncbi:MAG: ABC transporter ATP-binding protein [Actinomycetota bacterium]|nr:ABC transporter ATP-binding protein [Actinomycetota bacterium]